MLSACCSSLKLYDFQDSPQKEAAAKPKPKGKAKAKGKAKSKAKAMKDDDAPTTKPSRPSKSSWEKDSTGSDPSQNQKLSHLLGTMMVFRIAICHNVLTLADASFTQTVSFCSC